MLCFGIIYRRQVKLTVEHIPNFVSNIECVSRNMLRHESGLVSPVP
jgi:hypothetical protein